MVGLVFVSFVLALVTGCATHRQTGATPVFSGQTEMVGDPMKRELSDRGLLFRGHRYGMKAAQYRLEKDLAEIEAEAIRRDFAASNGIPYTMRPVGGGVEPNSPRGFGNTRTAGVMSPQYGYTRNGAPILLPSRNRGVGSNRGTGIATPQYQYDRRNGAPVLLPNRSSGRTSQLQPGRQSGGIGAAVGSVAGGFRSFLLPTIYPPQGGNPTSFTAGVRVSGRVNVPVTGFEKSALAHARQMDPNFDRNRRSGVSRTASAKSVQIVGGGQFVSGLPKW